MYLHILDIHKQLLHRCFCLLSVILYKLPFVRLGLDFTAIQQALFSHKSIHFFSVDDETLITKIRTHYPVSIINEINAHDELSGKNQTDIGQLCSIVHLRADRWLTALFSRFTSVIETATVDTTPIEHQNNLYLTFKELYPGF